MADPDESRSRDSGGARGIERAGAILAELAEACASALVGLVEEQEARLSDRTAALVEAARSAARSLEGSDNYDLARGIEQAAERIDGLARILHERNWREIADGTADFARRRPRLFGLAAVALGFLAGRLAAAPADREEAGEPLRAAAPGAAAQGGNRGSGPGDIGRRHDGEGQ
jgi:uncharacterized protein YjeT (DUF2065 family)